mmetsp:Transcript_11426/g.13631  ORF Transcript_11426/g.13631 Transcript_11426/m.13631 type:complete len:97 (-) Transcript_11426:165-455(-)|eukprot:jgi/Bigna1/61853/fgenesh1_kg.27_\
MSALRRLLPPSGLRRSLLKKRNISTRSSLRGGEEGPFSVKKNPHIEGNAGTRDFLNESFKLSENLPAVLVFGFGVPILIYKAIKSEQTKMFGKEYF